MIFWYVEYWVNLPSRVSDFCVWVGRDHSWLVKVVGQVNAVGPTLIVGSFFLLILNRVFINKKIENYN